MKQCNTCLTKHFATRLQLILFTKQFSGSEAVHVLVEINSMLVQLVQWVAARERWRCQMTKTVDTSVWCRTVTLSCWFTLSHTHTHMRTLPYNTCNEPSISCFCWQRNMFYHPMHTISASSQLCASDLAGFLVDIAHYILNYLLTCTNDQLPFTDSTSCTVQ